MIWLLGLPQWLALLIVVGGLAGLSAGGFRLVHLRWPAEQRRKHNDVAGFIFAAAGVMYGVLLGFVVVVLWQQFSDASEATEHEAAIALTLQHELTSGVDDDTTVGQPALLALDNYVRLIVAEEYPRMAAGEVPPNKTPAMAALWSALAGGPAGGTLSRARDLLDDLEEARVRRLFLARNHLPTALWLAIGLGGIVTIGFGCLFGAENELVQGGMVAALAALIGMLVYVAIELDHPFIGRLRVTPAGFEQVLAAPGRGSGPSAVLRPSVPVREPLAGCLRHVPPARRPAACPVYSASFLRTDFELI
jgi:Protein of unknown function (DUF4239)